MSKFSAMRQVFKFFNSIGILRFFNAFRSVLNLTNIISFCPSVTKVTGKTIYFHDKNQKNNYLDKSTVLKSSPKSQTPLEQSQESLKRCEEEQEEGHYYSILLLLLWWSALVQTEIWERLKGQYESNPICQ